MKRRTSASTVFETPERDWVRDIVGVIHKKSRTNIAIENTLQSSEDDEKREGLGKTKSYHCDCQAKWS